jgi:hypothetical protein
MAPSAAVHNDRGLAAGCAADLPVHPVALADIEHVLFIGLGHRIPLDDVHSFGPVGVARRGYSPRTGTKPRPAGGYRRDVDKLKAQGDFPAPVCHPATQRSISARQRHRSGFGQITRIDRPARRSHIERSHIFLTHEGFANARSPAPTRMQDSDP